jgi:histidinol dehydrogenase
MKAIEEEISKQCQSLPRGEYASKALSHSFTVFARDMVEVSPLFENSYVGICCFNPMKVAFSAFLR